MSDTVPAAFFAQWSALQEENRQLQQKVNDLTNVKMDWLEERVTLQNKYDNLKKEHDELVEEHRDYMEEMINLNTRLKQELDKANDKQFKMEEVKKVLMEKFYDCSVGQFDLIALFNYCKAYGVSADVMKATLTADHRKKLTLPSGLNSLVGDDNVKEFFETVAALPNLKSITGYFTSVEDCYIQYKEGNISRKVLEAYCAGSDRTSCQLTSSIFNTIRSAGLSVSDYLSMVLPLLPQVTGLSLPDDVNTLLGDADVKELLEAAVASLPSLKSITGYFTSIEDCYIQYKEGNISRKVLKAYCGGYNTTTYQLTRDEVNTLQSAKLSVSEYLTTILPFLPKVTYVSVYRTSITTLDWCAALPDSITRLDIRNCPDIQDCTPLLQMKGLKDVWYDSKTNSSFNAVKEQLTSKGVTCVSS
ncbi:hypothetical protein AGDE_13316 [Angomonas deanei]|uniref:Uncharacterized protein n=1 Tax=Angomonas deanei TaxID=59799 RepID=A0A7G2C5R4_9TRYP|nr:hypothetical protein AGDE_13316 [Angomonas deanei]CAD2214494.1 hypothetical protein, conserved [Angomonas deanei]|eukprot:EPY22502.1 hypothetical protein AGDE_13316 [Angomonas deanei]